MNQMELLDLSLEIRRKFASAVWVPLRLLDRSKQGKYPTIGFYERYDGAHAIIVPAEKRMYGEQYSWSDNHDARPWADSRFYKTSDVYSHSAEIDVGFRPILEQNAPGVGHPIWHVHQDLILALGLIQEGDKWVRPEENYVEVIRIRRNQDNHPISIEIRAEHLKDYLSARSSSLRISSYRERSAVVGDIGKLGLADATSTEAIAGGKLEKRVTAIDSMGGPYGSQIGVFHISRTDVEIEDDVPVIGRETEGNTVGSSRSFTRAGPKLWRISTEYWRDEWIEPAAASLRVRSDRIPSEITFIVDADGSRMNADALDSADVGRWLWFTPQVIAGIAERRGAELNWYSRDTGGISIPCYPSTHFGLNQSDLITVYAYDVARLPEWERRYWAGFNLTPEGGVSAELVASQVRATPASTEAPEQSFGAALDALNSAWRDRFDTDIIRPHPEANAIRRRIHRFRALNLVGLLSLAKDIARLTADSINAAAAQAIDQPAKGETRGSLKSLEFALAKISDSQLARKTMGPLFAIYDLRLADAHLPKSDIQPLLSALGISESDSYISSGLHLIDQCRITFESISIILKTK